jgi:hypothetical protein
MELGKVRRGAVYTSDYVCNFLCDLHANRRCDLVYLRFVVRQESISIFFSTILQMQFYARFRVRCSIHSAADMKSHGTCEQS